MCRVRPEVEGITRRRACTRQEQIVGLPFGNALYGWPYQNVKTTQKNSTDEIIYEITMGRKSTRFRK
jgi:hypothetical protein